MSDNGAWIVVNVPKAVEVARALLQRCNGDRSKAALAATEMRTMAREREDVKALIACRFACELLASEWQP